MPGTTVSTIIPAYRAARTIRRALDSVLAQTRRPDEIVVVDDGSPDDLAAALKPYRHSVTLVRQPNAGAAGARNLGIDRSRGGLIAFLDADDYWEPTKLERQLDIFHRYPEVGLTASRFFQQPPGGPRVASRAEPGCYEDRVLRAAGNEVFEIATKTWTSTVVVRRDVLAGHRFEPGLEPAEDRDLWVRLITLSPVYLLSQRLATAVLEPGSLSRSSVDVDCGNMLRVVRRHRVLLGRRALRSREAGVFRRWASVYLAQGPAKAALHPAWQRCLRQPFSPEAWWILLKCAALAGVGQRLLGGRSSSQRRAPSLVPANPSYHR